MAEKPIKTPLPADLPEDWNAGQIVAPDGTAVGLTEQHGYNYLMAAVNRAQRGVNAVNEAFEAVSGKRTCRFVVGTSTAGWTEADCDYLCDGTDDQVDIQRAIDALPEAGGEIVLLDGTYLLSADISVSDKTNFVSITGNFGSTVLSGSRASRENVLKVYNSQLSLEGITLREYDVYGYNTSLFIRNCFFLESKIRADNGQNEGSYAFLCDNCKFYNSVDYVMSVECAYDSDKEATVISNNTIETKYQEGRVPIWVNYSNNCVFEGNSVKCIGSSGDLDLYIQGTVSGNILYNCRPIILGTVAIVGNRMTRCDLRVSIDQSPESCSTVSGNSFEDGTVNVAGNVSVIGNAFVTNEGSGISHVVRLYKTAATENDDLSPVIVGNCIKGGLIGILLEDPPTAWNAHCKNALINSNRIYKSKTPIRIGEHWSNCMVTDNLFTTGAIEDNGIGNIVRFNSDDTGGGGSTPTTVQQATPTITVNGDGTVTARATQAAGYVAAGTRSATYQISSADDANLTPENIKEGVSIFGVTGNLQSGGGAGGVTSSNGSVSDIQAVTQAEYDALTTKNPTTLYLIKE